MIGKPPRKPMSDGQALNLAVGAFAFSMIALGVAIGALAMALLG